jgi:fermentation-respiration switch protein FrsA (DUF1100 family)
VRVLASVVLVIGVVVLVVWSLQRQLIYYPDATRVPPADRVIPDARDVTLRTRDGLELGAWFVPARTTEPGPRGATAVLVAPGNGGNREGRAELAEALSRRGLAVLLMDYRGYGGNPGDPSEEGLAADADAAVSALTELGHPPERTVYFGESLGTGVVAALASRRRPAAMVLRSPFTELADVGAHHYPWLPVRLVLRDRVPVLEHVRRSDVPLTVIHAGSDSVVPSRLSVRVADASPSLVERVVIADADHNDPVMFGDRVAEPVARLAEQVR